MVAKESLGGERCEAGPALRGSRFDYQNLKELSKHEAAERSSAVVLNGTRVDLEQRRPQACVRTAKGSVQTERVPRRLTHLPFCSALLARL